MNENGKSTSLPGVRVRPMDRGDLDAVLDIDAQITGKERATSWSDNVADYLAGGLSSACRVAELNGKVVGFLLGDVRGFEYGLPRGGWIDVLGVSPQYQRTGIGARLVESFYSYCRRQGVEKIYLLALRGDERLESFFRGIGFGDSSYTVLEKEVK